MSFMRRFESFMGWLLYNRKGLDALLFTNKPMFTDVPQSIDVDCTEPDVTDHLLKRHTPFGEDRFPSLAWKTDGATQAKVREFVVLAQDLDVPLPRPALHGSFYAIPASQHALTDEDIRGVEEGKGTLMYGKTMMNVRYIAARPLVDHGEHRYVYMVVGLSEPLHLPFKAPLKRIEAAMAGKIVAYGKWTGAYRRTWDGEC